MFDKHMNLSTDLERSIGPTGDGGSRYDRDVYRITLLIEPSVILVSVDKGSCPLSSVNELTLTTEALQSLTKVSFNIEGRLTAGHKSASFSLFISRMRVGSTAAGVCLSPL